MTINIDEDQDPLAQALARLPKELEPARDLWPQIAAEIRRKHRSSWPWIGLLAASVACVIVGALLIFNEESRTQRASSLSTQTGLAPPLITADPHYKTARAQLTAQFNESLERLPVEDRERVRHGLMEIENGLRALNDALQKHPDNIALQQLVLSSYQRELEYLQTITAMARDLGSEST